MRLKRTLMLAPALAVVGGLFAGGVGLAIVQSLGLLSPLGENQLTLSHYRSLLGDREFQRSIGLTLSLAMVATGLSALGGLVLALSLRTLATRYRLFNTLLQIPLAMPHLSMAVVLLNVIAPSGLLARLVHSLGLIDLPAEFPVLINDGWGIGIVMAYLLKEIPFVTLMLLTLLLRIGDEYEQAARTLGASSWQRLRYVTLPLLAPAALSSSLMVFAFILGAFEVPYLLGRPYPAMLSVVAQRRYMDVDLAARPGAIAVAVMLSLITTALVWLYLKLARRLAGTERPLFF